MIEYDLDAKKKLTNATLGVKRRDVLYQKLSTKDAMEIDEDPERSSGESSDESGSEATAVDDDGDPEAALPKSASGQVKGMRGRNERVLSADEVRAHLRLLFSKEPVMCNLLYGRHGSPNAPSVPIADMFFMDVLPVPPTRFRPAAKMGDELFENAQNSLLSAVLATSKRIQDLNQRLHDEAKAEKGEMILDAIAKNEAQRTFASLLDALIKLQHDVNSFMDSSKNPTVMRQGKLPPQGVKQVLEKKEGLFRKHMMGKRVNYAARSVISPDINIETNEIGIPPVFAKKLTYPEPVTPQNVHELRQLVINGPRIHPGASIVQNEDGSQTSLVSLLLCMANVRMVPLLSNGSLSRINSLPLRETQAEGRRSIGMFEMGISSSSTVNQLCINLV